MRKLLLLFTSQPKGNLSPTTGGVQPCTGPDAPSPSQIAINESRQLGLGNRTNLGRLNVAALEQHQGRNAADTKFRRRIGVLIDVQLRHLEAAVILIGDLVQDRCNHLARTAPVGPVIHQHRPVGLDYFLFKGVVGHVNNFVAQCCCLHAHDSDAAARLVCCRALEVTFEPNPGRFASPQPAGFWYASYAMSETHLTETRFADFDLPAALMQGIEEAGFSYCTPIQADTLPLVLAGQDVAGQAQTGTGKTAAFLIALYNRLLTVAASPQRRPNQPRALVVAPTRELAIQIHRDAETLGRHSGLSLGLAYGGTGYEQQRTALEQGVDILIATPGRLIDYFKQHVFDLKAIQVVVVDEADRMFDLGFIADLRYLLRRMPAPQQRLSMLFSATLSLRVTELAYEHMNNPVAVEIAPDKVTADRVKQAIYYPASDEKIPLLLGLLKQLNPSRAIVFVNTKRVADRVWGYLEGNGYKTAILSGDVPQKKRQQLLGQFESGEFPLLVATDVAARGLHIPDVTHVFNYDLPQDAEDYVHRIGRTARAGASGEAISFACEEYAFSLVDIESYIGHKIPTAPISADILEQPLPPVKSEYHPRPGGRNGPGGGRGRDNRSGQQRRRRSKPHPTQS